LILADGHAGETVTCRICGRSLAADDPAGVQTRTLPPLPQPPPAARETAGGDEGPSPVEIPLRMERPVPPPAEPGKLPPRQSRAKHASWQRQQILSNLAKVATRSTGARVAGALALLVILVVGLWLAAKMALSLLDKSLAVSHDKLAAIRQATQDPGFIEIKEPESAVPRFIVTVEPHYESRTLRVNVGKFSQGLASREALQLRKSFTAMKNEWPSLGVEAMYVAAIRLYDLGQKDDATYWFYSAQHRARLVQALAVAGQGGDGLAALAHACAEFDRQAGGFINGHAFGDPEKLAGILAKVRDENQSLPALRQAYPNLAFLPDAGWPVANNAIRNGWSALADFVRDNREPIMNVRQFTKTEHAY
jgi:type IV secretory pathway TrbD component